MDNLSLLREYINQTIGRFTDTYKGHGYSRNADSRFHGMNWISHSTFPYKDLSSKYIDNNKFCCDNCKNGEECDSNPLKDKSDLKKFIRKINLQYYSADPIKQRVGDRFAFTTGATKLGERHGIVYQSMDGVYAIRPRSSRNSPGTKRGFFGAPPPVSPEQDDDPIFDLKDLAKKRKKREVGIRSQKRIPVHPTIFEV